MRMRIAIARANHSKTRELPPRLYIMAFTPEQQTLQIVCGPSHCIQIKADVGQFADDLVEKELIHKQLKDLMQELYRRARQAKSGTPHGQCSGVRESQPG